MWQRPNAAALTLSCRWILQWMTRHTDWCICLANRKQALHHCSWCLWDKGLTTNFVPNALQISQQQWHNDDNLFLLDSRPFKTKQGLFVFPYLSNVDRERILLPRNVTQQRVMHNTDVLKQVKHINKVISTTFKWGRWCNERYCLT